MNLIPKINGKISLTGGTCAYNAETPVSVARDTSLPKEGYSLTVDAQSIEIKAGDAAGEFYARQTLEQLARDGGIPCGTYQDAPKYAFRSFMLDVSRHFFSAEDVKKLLDQMAKLKLNTFHWHLSDDQGFRIESKKFPMLNEIGSWRNEDGQKVGGYYTQDEIRDVVSYAAQRHITVIPEIDLPGHTGDIVATMPELSCSGEPLQVGFGAGLNPRILCAGNDKVYEFLYQLLDEVCGLFPGPYFHIGGDEAPKSEWEKCPRCQQRIKEEGLKDEEDLQAWFTGKLVEFLESRGKTAIGWNEILTSGTVSPNAIAQYWIDSGKEYSDKEADKGRRFVFSNTTSFYLDYPCALVSIRSTYEYEPYIIEGKDIPAGQILGLEAPLWTERVADIGHVQRLVFPRLLALAENCWTAEKDFDDFMARAEVYVGYLKSCGVESTPLSESCFSGEEGARMAGIQLAEVLVGFFQGFQDKVQRSSSMREIGSMMTGSFAKSLGFSEKELAIMKETLEKEICDMGL